MRLALASLEPSGYRSPNSGIPSNRYLSPSNSGSSIVLTPKSHYLPTPYQNPTQPNVIPNSQYLPSNHVSVLPHSTSVIGAMPSVQYLPTDPNQLPHSSTMSPSISNHYHRNYDAINTVENSLTSQRPPSSKMSVINSHTPVHSIKSDVIPARYLPPSQRPGTFTQAIPSSNYLPANQNQYSNEINQLSVSMKPPISNIYLMPNRFLNSQSESNIVGSPDPFNGYSNSDSFGQSLGTYNQANGGYSDGISSYDNGPDVSKYEFAYAVKDEFGNDYTHKQSQNGDDTRGVYTVLLPDGRKQIVHYTANNDGYKPSITYEETATKSGYDQGYKY
ncbi:hypothetical protein PV327_008303 [Microctonus hyperodae]|uniref:Pro-resilin n=1 Tax=Microctonus hyperodae TaxID=165561 RepID=A0AA39F2V5_MICHY|nr:hypothetical protein PV327_008303 [Microctonus hyperodae]